MKKFAVLGLTGSLLAVGCGGGSQGSRYDYQNPDVPAPVLRRTFVVSNFGPADNATLFRRNIQTFQTGPDINIAVNSTVSAKAAPPMVASRAASHVHAGHRDLPFELETKMKEAIEIHAPAVRARGIQGIRPKFEGVVNSTQIKVPGGATVECRKLSDDAVANHCNVFAEVVEGNPVLTPAQVDEIIQAWEVSNPRRPGNGIYQQVREVFGPEWDANGGRDGNSRVNLIFLSDTTIGSDGTFGFFAPTDEFPASEIPESNEAEILYLNAGKFTNPDDIFSTLAHEFVHLINFNTKFGRQGAFNGVLQNDAVDEGQAVLAEDLTGYDLAAGNSFIFATVAAFEENPDRLGIFEFDGSPDGYGRGYTLQRYLYDRFGPATYAAYAQNQLPGLEQFNSAFPNFGIVFGDWAVAMVGSNLLGVPAEFRFGASFDPKGTYTIEGAPATLPGWQSKGVVNPTTNDESTLRPWSIQSLEYINGTGQNLTLEVSGPAGTDAGVLVQRPEGTFSEKQ